MPRPAAEGFGCSSQGNAASAHAKCEPELRLRTPRRILRQYFEHGAAHRQHHIMIQEVFVF